MRRPILIVEDDDDGRRALVRMMISAGYQVRSASTYAEAMVWIQGADFRLLLVDISLPDGGRAGPRPGIQDPRRGRSRQRRGWVLPPLSSLRASLPCDRRQRVGPCVERMGRSIILSSTARS